MLHTQNSQQKSVPDLHVVTVAFLALKNGFSEKKILPQKKIFFYLFSMQLFSADATMFSNFFFPQKVEKITLKSCS